MLFNVPQYIDVEDKVAGPLTAKQLMWILAMGAVLLVMWTIFDKATFFILAIPVGAIFLAMAFYRPYKQPLIKFIASGIMFAFRPKIYIWKRTHDGQTRQGGNEKKSAENVQIVKKSPSLEEVADLTKLVDSRGSESSERIMELLKKKNLR
jgi:hypothetical protein